jgi:hypothetical protein
MTDEDVKPYLTLVRAAEHRRPDDVDKAISFATQVAKDHVRSIPDAAPIFAMFGRLDLVFASLDRYFNNKGAFGTPTPITQYSRRFTDFLFSVPMGSVRADPRYTELTRTIGLQDYWRRVGMAPPSVSA